MTTFGLEIVQVQETAKGWDPADRRRRCDGDADRRRPGDRQSGAIWFGIVWLPAILVLVVLLLVGRWAFRRLVPTGGPSGPVAGWGDGA